MTSAPGVSARRLVSWCLDHLLRMTSSNRIKTAGYVVSTLSVVLLGAVSWQAASASPVLMSCLIVGMLASAAGMVLRWISYQVQEREERGDRA